MLVEDFDDYVAEPHSARRAMHCAISAYHLREWVWKDWFHRDEALQKVLGIANEQQFNRRVNYVCPWFGIIRDLANGNKHFEDRAQFKTLRVIAAPFAFDQLHAGFDQGAWDGPVRYVASSIPVGPAGKGYLLIDSGEIAGEDDQQERDDDDEDKVGGQRFQPVGNVLEVVVRFWRDVFRKYCPDPSLPVSRHHVD